LKFDEIKLNILMGFKFVLSCRFY